MSRTHWIIAGTVAAVTLAAIGFGYAASQSFGTKTLGGNNAAVSRCDTDGVTIVHNLSGSNVISVTIGSIASACATATLSVDVNNGTANSTGSGTVPAGGGSMTVSLAAGVAADDGMETDVAISGP
jgi:hypothetical protein